MDLLENRAWPSGLRSRGMERLWSLAVATGATAVRIYDESEWRDGLVVVTCGEIELESVAGDSCRFWVRIRSLSRRAPVARPANSRDRVGRARSRLAAMSFRPPGRLEVMSTGRRPG